MREAGNIREVEALGIDLMGFIFWPKSKRYVSELPAYLPEKVQRVGVFVDADIDDIRRTAETYSLDIIQLHGSESPEFIRGLRNRGTSGGIRFIKAFNIATAADLAACRPYEGLVDNFLFDTKATLPGGSGQQFDWSVLSDYTGETPFLLSGGIGPGDAERVKAIGRKCIGIDLNSRFETAPGLKDVAALKTFINKLKTE